MTGIENIDELPLTDPQRQSEKADYFAENRRLIIELKSLETDTNPKIEMIVEPHRLRPDFPIFFGEWEVEKVLKHLPDGEDIRRKIVNTLTSSLKKVYRKANRQVRTTKKTFSLPSAQGLLIILNEKIELLTPEIVVNRFKTWSETRNPDNGDLWFQEINCVLFITEAHFFLSADNVITFPFLPQPIEVMAPFEHEEFLGVLFEKWSEYNNVPPIYPTDIGYPAELDIQSLHKFKEEQKIYMPRQEAWIRYYKWNPYFRSYDDKMLLWMFKIIMSENAFGFIEGATDRQKERNKFWVEVFTHFMEEVNYRGIDIRFFTLHPNFWSEVDGEMKKRFPNG